MNEYYTYAYLREDRTPYYVGRGKGRRCLAGHNVPVPDKSRILMLKTDLTFEESVEHEIYMIAVLGRKDLGTGILRNLTNGGDGAPGRVWFPSKEIKQKISTALKGKTKSSEHVAAVSEALSGKPFTESHKQALSKAWEERRKTPVSQETRDKISNIHKGRKRSEETKRKLSEAAKLRELKKRTG